MRLTRLNRFAFGAAENFLEGIVGFDIKETHASIREQL
jgi:hypothetical protein